MTMTVEERTLGYCCPRCRKAAFFLPGCAEDYETGRKIDSHEVSTSIMNPKTLMGEALRCQWCRMPFTLGTLYLKNIGTFGKYSGMTA